MPSKRSIERFSGILLLLMLVTSILGAVFASAVGTDLNVPGDEVAEVLQLVAGNQGLHQVEIGFDLASYVILVALSGARTICNADQYLPSQPRPKKKEDHGYEPHSLQQSHRIRCLRISKHMP
jgi:hypothetical protein